MPTFTEREYQSILNKKKQIDSWFWDRYTINPYNGCLFGCIYCDARSMHYHMPEQFENEIVIKKNIGPLLEQRLRKARSFLPDVVGIGGVTDSYQPAEKLYRNTRQTLEVLAKYKFPVHLATKSTLVLEDLDLLKKIAQQSWCTISVTITTLDQELARFLDFRAPSPQKRLDVIRQIKTQAPEIQCGVLLIPLVPYFGDDPESLKHFFQKAKATGADYVLYGGGMTMRNKQALWFLKHLKEKYPELIPKYESLYRFTYNSKNYEGEYIPNPEYLLEKHQLLMALSQQYQMPFRIPRFLPADFRHYNYKLAEHLFLLAYQKQMQGIKEWNALKHIAHHIQSLSQDICMMTKMGLLDTIPKMNEVVEKIIIDWLNNEGLN